MTATRWNAAKWVQSELDIFEEGYGNEPEYARTFLREQLLGDEYRHELTDAQVARALAALANLGQTKSKEQR